MAQITNTTELVVNAGQSDTFSLPVVDNATLLVNGGKMEFIQSLDMVTRGNAEITNNGTLTLDAASQGGIIDILSGTLAFGPTPWLPYPQAASHCTTNVELTGKTGEIDMGQKILSVVDQKQPGLYGTQDLLVTVAATIPGGPAQTDKIYLVGGAYSQHEFTIHGTAIMFNK